MFGLDAFHLARIQFAFTVSFHIIFPPTSLEPTGVGFHNLPAVLPARS